MLQKMSSIGSLNNKLELTDQFDNVTILFADISGFTAYSNQVQSPKQVVKLLRELFEGFDKQCLKFQVYKMYTIGDCYVVLGLNQTFNRTPEIIQKECKNGNIFQHRCSARSHMLLRCPRKRANSASNGNQLRPGALFSTHYF